LPTDRQEGGRLTQSAMDHGIEALQRFTSIARRHGVTRFRAVATSAVREAKNGGEFIQRIYDEVGLRVRVIPGREEARLIYLGVSQVVDLRRGPVLLFDVGGGSVELVLVENGKPASLAWYEGGERVWTKELDAIHTLRPAAILVRQHRAAMNPAEALIGSQIVSVADAYDTLLSGTTGKRRGRAAALTALQAGVGSRYRAEVVAALAAVVAARADRGHHRRRSDAPAVESGAA